MLTAVVQAFVGTPQWRDEPLGRVAPSRRIIHEPSPSAQLGGGKLRGGGKFTSSRRWVEDNGANTKPRWWRHIDARSSLIEDEPAGRSGHRGAGSLSPVEPPPHHRVKSRNPPVAVVGCPEKLSILEISNASRPQERSHGPLAPLLPTGGRRDAEDPPRRPSSSLESRGDA